VVTGVGESELKRGWWEEGNGEAISLFFFLVPLLSFLFVLPGPSAGKAIASDKRGKRE
jgi:hypothetical protein